MEYSANALLILSIASLLLSAATASSLFTIPRAFSTDLDSSSTSSSSSAAAAVSPSQSPASSPSSLPISLPASETSSSSSSSLGLLSSAAEVLTSPLKVALPAVDPAVKSICDQTDFSFLCVSSLLPYLVDGKLDPVSVLGKEIKAAVDASEKAVAEVSKMAEDQSTSDATKTVLKGCIESYGNAVDNLKEAGAAMAVSDIGQVNSMLSAAITSFTTCEEGFEDAAPGAVSPTQVLFDPLEKMTSNCLAIVGSIQNIGV